MARTRSTFPKSAEVVIIGGGINGTGIAYYLARKGKDVVLLERGDVASGASGANNAMIWVSTREPGVMLKMGLLSIEEYRHLSEDLGWRIEYKRTGGITLIEAEEHLEAAKGWIESRQRDGLDCLRLITRDEIQALQHYVADHILGGIYCPLDGCIYSIWAVLAFADHAKEAGARIITEAPVTDIIIKKRGAHQVVTSRGTIKAKTIVNAAGAWSAEIGKMAGLDIPSRPCRLQVLVTQPIPGKQMTCNMLTSGYRKSVQERQDVEAQLSGLSINPIFNWSQNGNGLHGSAEDFVGVTRKGSLQGIVGMCKGIDGIVPRISDKILVQRGFANVFPWTVDHKPILGKVDGINGFIMAAGHNDIGMGLGAGSAKLISQLILHGDTQIPIGELNLRRFDEPQGARSVPASQKPRSSRRPSTSP